MKYEVEVKAKVKDFTDIVKRLKKLGCKISKPISQHDFAYYKIGVTNTRAHSVPVLRIRVEKRRTLFTLKMDRSNDLDCIEKETEVADGKVMEEIAQILGYRKGLEIKKTRRKTKFGVYEICLDTVERLHREERPRYVRI